MTEKKNRRQSLISLKRQKLQQSCLNTW